jgi:hypothetical protein
MRDDALEIVAAWGQRILRGQRDRRVDLHVGVVDLAGLDVIRDRGEPERVARVVVGPRVVEDDDVLVSLG